MFLSKILPCLVVMLAALSIGFFIAASGDFIHLFEIDQGKWDVVISTTFESSLVWAIPLACCITFLIWLGSSFTCSNISRKKFKDVMSSDGLSYLPLLIGLLIPLRYLPDVASYSSGLFLLSSTLMGPVLFVAALLVLFLKYRLFRKKEPSEIDQGEILKAFTDRTLGLIIFGVVFLFYLITVPIFASNSVFGGDQPHYLIVSHSIIDDGDIYIKDDHDSGVSKEFTKLHIDPQFFERTNDSRIIPFHRIGLPLLAAIPYWLLGKLGALLMLGLFAAVSSANIFWLCTKLIKNRKASLWATLWVTFSAPAFLLSYLFFTENVAVMLTLIALNLIIRKDEHQPPRLWWLIPMIIWLLPWMHARDMITAIAISLLLLFKLRKIPLKLAMAGILCVVFFLAIPLFNLYFYGNFSPVAEMGSDQGMAFRIANVTHGIGGILFDQEFGLFLYNPALLIALAGMVPLFFRNASMTVWLIIIMGFSIGPSLLFRMWWGGGSPPARYIVAVFHLLALPLAALLADRAWKKLRPVFYILFACGLVISGILLVHNHLLIDDRDGSAKLLSSVSAGHIDAVEWWPSWIFDFERSWPLAGLLIAWLTVTIVLFIFLKKLSKSLLWGNRNSLPAGVFAGLLFFLISFICYTGVAESITPEEPNGFNPTSHTLDTAFHSRYRSGNFDFINIGNNRQLSFPARRFSCELLFGKENLSADEKAGRGRSKVFSGQGLEILVTDQVPFWAGKYRITVGMRSEKGQSDTELNLYSGDNPDEALVARKVRLSENFQPYSFPVTLENNCDSIRLHIKAEQSSRFLYLTLRPESLITRKQWEKAPGAFQLTAWKFGDLVLTASEGSIYKPEGRSFWTVGNSTAFLTISADNKRETIDVVLRSRPGISILLEKKRYDFTKTRREIKVTLSPQWQKTGNNHWFCEISASTTGKFTPANYNKSSTDTRNLGVQFSFMEQRK